MLMEASESRGNRLATPQWVRAVLIVLLLSAFALRLFNLGGKSLWSDEGLTLRRAEQPLDLVFRNVNVIPVGPNYQDGRELEVVDTPDLHPPLYFLLMHVWIRLAGTSEFALRFPSVVGGILALPLLYALARSLMSREAGLWAALLGTVSPFFLWYSQEARMYTWLVVLSLASIYTFLSLLEDSPNRRDYAAFVAVALALVYTHYAGLLLVALEFLVYVIYRLRKRPQGALTVLVVVTVALLPLTPFVWRALRVQAFSFSHRPLFAILWEASSSFSLGPTRAAIQPLWRLSPFLLLFVVGVAVLGLARPRRIGLLALGYLALPVLAQYLLSFVRPTYMNPRHLMAVAPAWELIVAQGVVALRRRWWPAVAVVLGVVLILRGEANHDILTSHQFWKDDIRGAVEYIEARARPGDAVVLHHPVIRLTFDYYYDGCCPQIVIPSYGNNDDTEQAREIFAEWAERHNRIWFLYGPPPTYFPHDYLPGWADSHLFKVDEERFEAWWTYVAVAAYDERSPVYDEIPDDAIPVDESWGSLHLTGLRVQETAAGATAWMDFYWRVDGSPPDAPLKLDVQLADEAGRVWVRRTAIVLPFYPLADWPTDRIVRTEFRLAIPEVSPPIAYSLSVEPAGLGDPRSIGHLRVVRPTGYDSTPQPLARFDNGVALLSAELESREFRAGHPLLGSFVWHADSAPTVDYLLQVRLVNSRGETIASSRMPLSAAGFPTSDWQPEDRVAGLLQWSLPADLRSDHYRVEISLVEEQTGLTIPLRRWYGTRDWYSLGRVRVEAWPLVTEVPDDIERRLEQVEIADSVLLLGYDLDQEEDVMKLTLYWQADTSLEKNYHVFVHVGVRDQPPLADTAGVPVDWTRPTVTWREGEVIVDQHVLSLSNVPPGRYELLVGLFAPDTGVRPKTVVSGSVVPEGYVFLEGLELE